MFLTAILNFKYLTVEIIKKIEIYKVLWSFYTFKFQSFYKLSISGKSDVKSNVYTKFELSLPNINIK